MGTRLPYPGEGEWFAVEECGDRESWLAARRRGIGGSDAPVLWREEIERAGGSVRGSPLSLYHEKRGLVPDEEETEAMEIGTAMEPAIVGLYQKRTGATCVYPGPFAILRSLRWPWMFVSPDRLIPEPPWEPGGLEAKWRAWEGWEEAPPLDVQLQVQHAMAVTGYQWWDVAGIVRGRFLWVTVEQSEEWIAQHVEVSREFCDRVERAEAPPPDEHPATSRVLRRLFPDDDGGTVELGESGETWVNVWTDARVRIKEAEKHREIAENHLRARFGSNTYAQTPAGRVLRLAVERKSGARVLREVKRR